MRHVNLHIESVPNMKALKLVLENGILTEEPYEFKSLAETAHSPLAQKLMMFRYVDRVLFYKQNIIITKKEDGPEWDAVMRDLRAVIRLHLEQDEPLIYEGIEALKHTRSDDLVAELAIRLLDQKIRPAAQADGGDILFESFADGVLQLRMHGACNGCHLSDQTIKQAVEPIMQSVIPEVKTVEIE